MSHVPVTRLFNIYDLETSSYEADRINSQEVVNYCEARFRVALQEIMKRSDADQGWMLKALFRELECCFSLVGVAAAVGMPLNIPVLIRSLGKDMFRFGMDQKKMFRPGIELIVYLDGNISSQGRDDPAIKVTDFHNAWWKGHSPPSKPSHIFSSGEIKSALERHREQLGLPGTAHIPPPLTTDLPRGATHADQPVKCTRCRLYQSAALRLMDQVRDIRNMLHAAEFASVAERDVAMRRASGFNELFEAALKKECERPRQKAQKVMEKFTQKDGVELLKSQIKELIEMCTSDPSRKWTWGVDLTIADLARLVRGADRHRPAHPHSGYDTDLEPTELVSVSTYSIDNSKIDDAEIFHARFEQLSPDCPSIPDLADDRHPPTLTFKMINASETSATSDSAIRAFRAGATANRVKDKLVLQEEVDEPDAESELDAEPDAESELIPHSESGLVREQSLIPRRSWVGPPLSALTSSQPLLSLIQSSTGAMDCDIPDNIYVPSSDDGCSQDVEMVGLEEEINETAPMTIWTRDRSPSDAGSDAEIPTSLFVMESDGEGQKSTELNPDTHSSDNAHSASIIARDPVSGRWTAESFTRVLDKFMD